MFSMTTVISRLPKSLKNQILNYFLKFLHFYTILLYCFPHFFSLVFAFSQSLLPLLYLILPLLIAGLCVQADRFQLILPPKF